MGVVTGLVVGKVVGITAFAWLAIRVGAARLPPRLDHVQILAVAVVAGIGFTVSLFVAELALRATTLANAKIGILAASVVAGLLGIVAVALTSRHRERPRS